MSPPKVWIVVGLFDEVSSVSTVGIIDLGVGVVASVKKKTDLIQKLKDLILASKSTDVIEAAIEGLRTESGERKHGKGLSTLKDFVNREANRRLTVLSSGGLVRSERTGISKQALPEFLGTIVVLEIGKISNPV